MVNLKEQVGIKAAEFVTDGMIVGLGYRVNCLLFCG